MGLDELKPGNNKRAKDTVISAFMAFVRYEHVEFDYVKRCIEQDPTDFTTCPLHAVTTALITQTTPSVALIGNLPEIPVEAAVTLTPWWFRSLLLVHRNPPLLYGKFTLMSTGCLNASFPNWSYRCAYLAFISTGVCAQHANGCHGLTHRWIFDRGAWNMIPTIQGFNYILTQAGKIPGLVRHLAATARRLR
ncbi:unnamed protein product [Phytophthora fragariaefolia]|uniref:Unnamed protein product n=1 Tax=Phytophthora fragariaefolia TaxID=1490495 RepID=A0A9W6XI85_9STRA|nr:unnamed protein product [Phytophthora fragariaefolia]